MKHIILSSNALLFLFYLLSLQFSFSYSIVEIDLVDVIQKYGYPAETHTVQTEDGYILTVYRIPHGINDIQTNPKPILITHALTVNSGNYVILNPDYGLGYILADNGYDVWLINCRGTSFSKKHVSIDESTDKKNFYNFSWHEIGVYDLPATIDYILEKTNKTQVHYNGHSQGGTSFLVMTSTRPDYNKKIKHASLFAPSAKIRRISPFIRFLSRINAIQILDMLGVYEVPLMDTIRGIIRSICLDENQKSLCISLFNAAAGYVDLAQADINIFRNASLVSPDDASVKQVKHYAQLEQTGEFRQYDYGPTENLKLYGTAIAPDYKLEDVTAPINVYVGANDFVVNPKDAALFVDVVKNATLTIVPFKYWNHLDPLFAKDVKTLLYDDVLKEMAKY